MSDIPNRHIGMSISADYVDYLEKENKTLKSQIARLEKVAAESHKLYEISDEINWRNIIISMPEVIWWRYDDWWLFKKYNEKEDELRKALNELKGVGK